MCTRHQEQNGVDSISVRYCSHPDGHAPKDCPDFQDYSEEDVYVKYPEGEDEMYDGTRT